MAVARQFHPASGRSAFLRTVVLFGVLLLGARISWAHHGFESEPQVRLLDNQTFVIVRMTAASASALLGPDAPAMWSDAVVAGLQARLRALGNGLLEITAGKGVLRPTSANVSLEVSGQVAFVMIYPPVTAWPVWIEAAYFRNLGPEFTGRMHVFGPPEQPTERFGREIAALDLTREGRSVEIPGPLTRSR